MHVECGTRPSPLTPLPRGERGTGEEMPEFNFWITLLVIAVVAGAVLNTVAYLILAERKVAAWVQDRLGPNRVGPWGLLQPIVDGGKMFLKEEVIPSHVDKIFFLLA